MFFFLHGTSHMLKAHSNLDAHALQLALDLSTAGMGCRALRLEGADLHRTHQMPDG